LDLQRFGQGWNAFKENVKPKFPMKKHCILQSAKLDTHGDEKDGQETKMGARIHM
jgi:hypothetical protein